MKNVGVAVKAYYKHMPLSLQENSKMGGQKINKKDDKAVFIQKQLQTKYQQKWI